MFVWVGLPADIDGHSLLERALIEANVAFVPGKAFFADGSGGQTIRLNFSRPGISEIEDGVRRLCDVVARWTARGASRPDRRDTGQAAAPC